MPGSELLFILLLSAVPTFEGRYALPTALLVTDINPLFAYLACTGVNLAVIPAVFLSLKLIVPPMRLRWKWIDSLFRRIVRRKIRKTHLAALFTFTATPLPGTGAYTGTLLAFMLGMTKKRHLAVISGGVVTANALTMLTTLGAVSILG